MIPKKHIIMPIAVMCVFNVLAANEIQDSLTVNLDEVSVTALKRMSAFRDDPAAATLITSKELDRLGIMSIKGISDVVPNFFMADYGSRITSSIYVRGIGARMDQPSVGLNVDNVPYRTRMLMISTSPTSPR